ncbi:MAG: polysaccharide pyruvyl transferase family protein [Gelidibacter sp.]
MKVAVIGWYHQNNAGDDRLLECIQSKLLNLGVDTVKVFIAWGELKTRIEEINACNFLLIGGGGLILRNTNTLVKSFKKITIPFGLLGVSVDSVGMDNTEFIGYLSMHSRFILVRDVFSRHAFANYKDTDLYLGPDLTFLYPYQNDDLSNQSNSVAVSLRPWKPNPFKQYTKNYHRYNKLSHKFPFINSFFGMWNVEKFIEELKKSIPQKLIPFPLHINHKNGDNVLLRHFFDSSATEQFDIEVLKKSDYLVGMRLHAIIFATQLGVPFIAINYASKVRNYVESLGLGEFVLEIDDYKSIDSKIRLLKEQKEQIPNQLLARTKDYNKQVHEVFDTIFNTYMA